MPTEHASRHRIPSVSRIIEFDVVRITALAGSPESHLAVGDCARPPAIGETGTVVHLTPTWDPEDPNTRYIVELNESDGSLVWLAEFSRNEIEFVARPTRAVPLDEVAQNSIEQLREQW